MRRWDFVRKTYCGNLAPWGLFPLLSSLTLCTYYISYLPVCQPLFFKKLKKVEGQGQVLRQTLQRGIQHSVLPLSIPYDRRYREPWCLLPKSTEREYITFPSVSTPFLYTVHQMLFSSRATDRRLSISHTLRTSFPFLWTIIVYQNFLKNAIGNSN